MQGDVFGQYLKTSKALGAYDRRRQERDGDSREARRKRKREADQQRAEYYGVGVFWARPATLSMLQLAQDLDQEDKAAYW